MSVTLDIQIKSSLLQPGLSEDVRRAIVEQSRVRAESVASSLTPAMRSLFDSRVGRRHTGRMREAFQAAPRFEAEGNEIAFVRWGYLLDKVSNAGAENENIRSLYKYVGPREHGWSGQRRPPVSRIAFWLTSTGGSARSAWNVAKSLQRGRQGLHAIKLFRASSEYRAILGSGVDRLAWDAVQTTFMRRGRSVTQLRGAGGRFVAAGA